MGQWAKIAMAIVLLAALQPNLHESYACTWAPDYFYQVTNLKGVVVGSKFPVLRSFDWFRHSVVRPEAELKLYNFCHGCDLLKLTPTKATITDADGQFDFGVLRAGHYFLEIDDTRGAFHDLFLVEIKGPPNPRESQLIDITLNFPDCTGGHQFIVTKR